MPRWYIFLVVLALAACSATGPAFRPTDTPSQSQSLIYVYRPDNWTLSARTALIEIDGIKLVHLNNNGYAAVNLSPGHHKIKQSWNYWLMDDSRLLDPIEFEFDAGRGEEHFFELSTQSEGKGLTIEIRWELKEVDTLSGYRKILNCKQQKLLKNYIPSVNDPSI